MKPPNVEVMCIIMNAWDFKPLSLSIILYRLNAVLLKRVGLSLNFIETLGVNLQAASFITSHEQWKRKTFRMVSTRQRDNVCLVSTETPRSPRGAEQRGVHGGREGVWLGVSSWPVADHDAAPHQEDHPGRRRGPEIDKCRYKGRETGGGVKGSGENIKKTVRE